MLIVSILATEHIEEKRSILGTADALALAGAKLTARTMDSRRCNIAVAVTSRAASTSTD